MEVKKALLMEFRSNPAGCVETGAVSIVIERVSVKYGFPLQEVWEVFVECIKEDSIIYRRETKKYYF